MACFDAFRNEQAPGKKCLPYLLVVQSDLLEDLRTCVVVPLGRAAVVAGKSTDKLMPTGAWAAEAARARTRCTGPSPRRFLTHSATMGRPIVGELDPHSGLSPRAFPRPRLLRWMAPDG